MYLYIDDKSFFLDWGCEFTEKISTLKKRDSIKFKLNIYVENKDDAKLNSFISCISSFPTNIYVSKSDYYWWCFDGCQLLDNKIWEDIDFLDFRGRDIRKFDIELTISYKDVYGSNKKTVIERDLKLKKLFNE